jgi:hypothetical protein
MSLRGRDVWPGVVVDVALPEVLLVRILVGLVVVGERWMVVLVGVCSRHVSDLFLRPVVVGNVSVLVLMHDGLVIVDVGQRPHLRESTRYRASSLSLPWRRPLVGALGDIRKESDETCSLLTCVVARVRNGS